VPLQRARRCRRFRGYSCVRKIPCRELSGVTKHCHGCERGLKRCLGETGRSCLLLEKQVSARRPLSTLLHGASLLIGAFESVEVNAWNSTARVKRTCRFSKLSGGCVVGRDASSMCCALTRRCGCCKCLL